MKALIAIESNGSIVTLVDAGSEESVHSRYFVATNKNTYEPTNYHEARQQFVNSLDLTTIDVDQFGEPIGLHEMESEIVVVIPKELIN